MNTLPFDPRLLLNGQSLPAGTPGAVPLPLAQTELGGLGLDGPGNGGPALPAPDVSSLPTIVPQVLKPHQQYLQEQMQKSANDNAAVESAMAPKPAGVTGGGPQAPGMGGLQMGGPAPLQGFNAPVAGGGGQGTGFDPQADYTAQRARLDGMGDVPPVPVNQGPAPITWQEGLLSALAALVDKRDASKFAALPFQVASGEADKSNAEAMQRYQLEDRRRQEQVGNAVRNLGLDQEQMQMQAAQAKQAYQMWLDGQHLTNDQARILNDHVNKLWDTYKTLAPGPQKAAFLAQYPELQTSPDFQATAGDLTPEQLKAQTDTHHIALGDYMANKTLPVTLAKDRAETAAIPARLTQQAAHDKAMEAIAQTNAGNAGARLTEQSRHDQAMEANDTTTAQTAARRLTFEFPGGVKASKLPNLNGLQHEVRVAQAALNKAANNQRYWAQVAAGSDPAKDPAVFDSLNRAKSDFIGAKTHFNSAQAALDEGQKQMANTPGVSAVIDKSGGGAAIAGPTPSMTPGPAPSGKVKMPKKQPKVDLATERSNAAAMIKAHPESKASIAAMYFKRTGQKYSG